MKLKCNRCKEKVNVILKPKIIPVQPDVLRDTRDKRSPKYTLMVNGICIKCKIHIKFVKQTPEVMEELNNYFDKSLPF